MAKELSHIASSIRASTTIAIDTKYKEMKAAGLDVIGFGAGEPDFDTPDNIKMAAVRAISANFTRYTPAAGTVELREAVCERLKKDCGVDYKPSQIVVSNGAKQALFLALKALINPGDEVVIPAPYWVSYYELAIMTGAKPVIVETNAESGWKMTADMLRAAITPNTKALMLNNPTNPSGVVYTSGELSDIARVCVENEIYIISDEIYYKLIYGDAKFTSVAALGEDVKKLTILVNGVSKSYAMTGWRIGYSAAEPEIAKVISNLQSHMSSAPNSIAQKAAEDALSGSQSSIELMRRAFEARLDYFVERAKNIGIEIILPRGAFYVMMDISKYIGRTLGGVEIHDADDFAEAFLAEQKVAVVPCTGFGAPHHVRWSYATSLENIKLGMDRLEAFLAEK